jgi:crotonobetainyl-CoA:carnitine CoA-transferase CaiB-like acyl-CoA transferase
MFAAYAIAAALFRRSQTGEGDVIDVSMFGGQIALLTYQAGTYFATGEVPRALGNGHPIVAPYDTFATNDGYVNIAVGNDALWQRFCGAVGLDEAAKDERFLTNAGRITNKAALYEVMDSTLSTMTTAEVVAALDAAAVPCGPINRIDEVFAEPQVAHARLRREVDHPKIGQLELTGFPYAFASGDLDIRQAPPLLGEHTQAILREAGYTDPEIVCFMESGAAA